MRRPRASNPLQGLAAPFASRNTLRDLRRSSDSVTLYSSFAEALPGALVCFPSAVLLAFLLVFVEHGAIAHAFSHLGNRPDTEQLGGPTSTESPCDQCPAFNAVAGGPPPAPALAAQAKASDRPATEHFQSAPDRTTPPTGAAARPDSSDAAGAALKHGAAVPAYQEIGMDKCSIALLVFGLATTAAPRAAEHAHKHGVVSLKVAVEASSISLQMEAPLDSLVGFEHAPRNSAQSQAVQAMFERINSPQKLFGVDAAGERTLKSHSAKSDALNRMAAKKADRADEHADLDVSVEFDCKRASAVRSVDLSGLLAAFPRIQRIDAQIASPAGQFSRVCDDPTRPRWGR